jgi:hypothetical protein
MLLRHTIKGPHRDMYAHIFTHMQVEFVNKNGEKELMLVNASKFLICTGARYRSMVSACMCVCVCVYFSYMHRNSKFLICTGARYRSMVSARMCVYVCMCTYTQTLRTKVDRMYVCKGAKHTSTGSTYA